MTKVDPDLVEEEIEAEIRSETEEGAENENETEIESEDIKVSKDVNINWDNLIEEESKNLEKEADCNAKLRRKDQEENEQGLSWKLLQVCIEYLEENESNWKKRKVEIEKERSRIEKKEKAAIMSKDAKIKHIQKKITESLTKLPEKERYRIEREEEIERRHELKRIKEDL